MPGFFGVGLGVRAKAFAPLIVGFLYGSFALAMSLVPVFNALPILEVLLAIAMAWWGYKKGASPALIARFRAAPTDGTPLRKVRAAAGDRYPVSRVHSRSHDLSRGADDSRPRMQENRAIRLGIVVAQPRAHESS